ALLGAGLIGGSLALALKGHAPNLVIVGFDTPSVLDLAHTRGAIDERAASPEAAVRDADVVILATPLAPALTLLTEIAPHLKPGAIVTDVGSVKLPVTRHAAKVLPDTVTFIGGHPMTGSEKRGVANADAVLFENAVYVLCPEDPESPAFHTLSGLIALSGARIRVMGAEEHDRAAARVSHIPQLMAITLVNQIQNDADAAGLAAGGFRDMTRIASSSFQIWRDILVGNEGPILDELGLISASLQRLRNRLAEGDMEAVAESFRSAASIRNDIPANSKGFLNPLSDVFVYTPDEPGALLTIVRVLTEASVDIKDIELLKIREGTGGTFRLGFRDAEASREAVGVLTEAGLHAYSLQT
ncbi:MAG: prephenate dehydrogenase, partial [Rhodothermales bacterium]|nr:prephenate dehydrogenase [Rhodothermales bacterium]